MLLTEYDEQAHIESERKIAIEEGIQQGIQQGIQLGLQNAVDHIMQRLQLSLEEACEAIGITMEEYQRTKEEVSK